MKAKRTVVKYGVTCVSGQVFKIVNCKQTFLELPVRKLRHSGISGKVELVKFYFLQFVVGW